MFHFIYQVSRLIAQRPLRTQSMLSLSEKLDRKWSNPEHYTCTVLSQAIPMAEIFVSCTCGRTLCLTYPEPVGVMAWQTCHVTTVWSYGRVTCRYFDFSHIDSTRNLNTALFTDGVKRRLLAILSKVEAKRSKLRQPSDAGGEPNISNFDEDSIINDQRAKMLFEFWKKKQEKELARLVKHVCDDGEDSGFVNLSLISFSSAVQICSDNVVLLYFVTCWLHYLHLSVCQWFTRLGCIS